MFVLTSCTVSEHSLSNEYIPDTDYPFSFYPQTIDVRIASNDEGYYILNGNYLYYMDKQSNKPVLLDNRPDNECFKNENGKNCNAFVSLSGSLSTLMQFYQDSLYTIEYKLGTEYVPTAHPFKIGEYELVRRDADGSNRKVIKIFPNAIMQYAAIHRGYFYYVVEDYDVDNEQQYQILRLPMNKLSKKPEVVYEGQHKNGSISRLLPYGSQIYFNERQEGEVFRVMRYDLTSSDTSVVWEVKDRGYPQIETIHQNQLYFWYYYYYSRTTDVSDIFDERGLKIYTSDLDGSNIRETNIQTAPIISNVYMDDRYTYVRPVWFQLRRIEDEDIVDELKIYKDDQLVHTIDMSHIPLSHSLYIGDGNYMFIQGDTDESEFIQYLDKSEIETGTASFKMLIDTPRDIQDTINETIELP